MTYTVTITSQGQISIPAKIRRKLGLDKTRQALIREEGGKVIVEPVKDFLELAGSLKEYAKGKKPLSNDELHEAFAKGMAEDFMKSPRNTG